MKQLALSLLLASLVAAALLTDNHADTMRVPVCGRDTSCIPDPANKNRCYLSYTIQACNQHQRYFAGETVNIQVALTNFWQERVWGNREGITPVVDIYVFGSEQTNERMEEYHWSQDHPDEVKYNVTLKPGELYSVKWQFKPKRPGYYHVYVQYVDPQGETRTIRLYNEFSYGIKPSPRS